MIGIDTTAVIAVMQDAHAVRNRATLQRVRDTMSTLWFSFYSDHSVAVLVDCPFPLPTAIRLFNFRPKSIFQRRSGLSCSFIRTWLTAKLPFSFSEFVGMDKEGGAAILTNNCGTITRHHNLLYCVATPCGIFTPARHSSSGAILA